MKQSTVLSLLAVAVTARPTPYEEVGSGVQDNPQHLVDTTVTATTTATNTATNTAAIIIQTLKPNIPETGYACPNSAGQSYTNKYGNFTILCPGTNKASKRADTGVSAFITQLSDCIDTCVPKKNCAGVTYTQSTFGCSGYKCLPAASGNTWAANLMGSSAKPCGDDYRSTWLYDVALLHNITVTGPNGTYTTTATDSGLGLKTYTPLQVEVNAGSSTSVSWLLAGLVALMPLWL